MSVYTLSFKYPEQESISIMINEDQIRDLFLTISDSKIFWKDEENIEGVWIDMSKVMCITFKKEQE